MKKLMVAFILGLLMVLAGCTSSQPAPKPYQWGNSEDTQAAERKIKQMEAQNPCSEQNLKTASAKQRHDCNPLQDVFDTASKSQKKTVTTQKQTAQAPNQN